MLTDPTRPDLTTPAGLGALRSQVQRWAARGSAGDASRTNPGEAAALLQQSTVSTPEPLSTNASQEGGSPSQSQSANASMMPIQSSSAPLPAGGGAAMGDQTGHVQFWNQASGGHVAQVTSLPGGGWGLAAPTLQPSQSVGSAGLVFGYGNGAPVPTPTASQYGAVVPQTPATTTATMTPQTSRIRTAIPSYQNCTIGNPSAAAGVGVSYPFYQPPNWAQVPAQSRALSAPDARAPVAPTWPMKTAPTPVSYPEQYSYQGQTVSTSPAVTYLQTQPVPTAPPPSGQTPIGGPPPPPGVTPPTLGGTPPAGRPTPPLSPASSSGAPPPGGPPTPNLNGYAYPPAQAPYNYGSVPGPVTGTRSYGMPSRIKNAVKMIQPFYSDSASVDKARTFWDAFDRAIEGLEDALRLSAFRECLKGKAGEQWWMYSQIHDFETLRTRLHNQFICQTPLQMIERLKSTKRSKGMSAEVWGDLISSLCDASQCYDADMR
ncbi:hypothetical protein PF004_g13857 [Phytophthora fragariae]|uniref:Uncharacterized protein n=2 Tax=Phytophthora fragariae TaxID=53985 RepID=A0A6G0NQX0_9STRA|nr:hypothetical protein PF004_g13857 [Phytophthora fragariae]